MEKVKITYLTIEEIVAKVVNMDYIPDGFSLKEMLSAFTEEAEVDYENAQIDHLPKAQIEPLKTRLEVCKARETLAIMLLKDLEYFLKINPSISGAMRLHGSTGTPRYMLDIIADGMSHKYGITIPVWPTHQAKSSSSTDTPKDVTWENIEIRIRKDNKIAFSHEKGKWADKTFSEIGLLDKRTQQPNHLAGILIGLSIGNKFPPTRTVEGKHKTAMCRLSKLLRTLTGIKSDPFTTFNATAGWKPRFKLTDDRKNADERAKNAAFHIPLDNESPYESFYDETDKLIEKLEKPDP